MAERPTMTFGRVDGEMGTVIWLDIEGRIAGYHVCVHLRASAVCEKDVDGEWVIPAELRELTQVDGPPVSTGGDQTEVTA